MAGPLRLFQLVLVSAAEQRQNPTQNRNESANLSEPELQYPLMVPDDAPMVTSSRSKPLQHVP